MLMVTARKQRLVLNRPNTPQSPQELRCHRRLNNPHLSQRYSRPPSKQQACRRPIQLLLLVSLRLTWQVPRALLSKGLKEMHNSANMVDIHKLAHKISLHCPKSRMTHSINRLPPPRAPSKVIQTNNHNPKLNPNLPLSLPHPTNSLPTTPPTRNSAMLTITITSNNMDCSKVPRANKMAPHPSSDHTAVTMVPKPRIPPNSRKVLPNQRSHVTPLLERLKPVATLLRTQLLKLSNQEPLRVRHPSNLVTSNNPRLETTPTATHTTPARTMLRT